MILFYGTQLNVFFQIFTMVNHFQGVENGCIGNEWVNVSKSKKTDR